MDANKLDEVLEILKKEADLTKDKSNEFVYGKSCGKMEAYSHAYFLVKGLKED